MKEIIALKDNAPEPKILEDEYEDFDENRTIFLSRFFITKEGRLGKEGDKENQKILLPQLFPYYKRNSFETLLEESPNQ